MKFKSKKNLNLILDNNYEPFEDINKHKNFINKLFDKEGNLSCTINDNKNKDGKLIQNNKICQRDDSTDVNSGKIVSIDDLWTNYCISTNYLNNNNEIENITKNTSNNPNLFNCTNNITSRNNIPEFVAYKKSSLPNIKINSIIVNNGSDKILHISINQTLNNLNKLTNKINLSEKNNFPNEMADELKNLYNNIEKDHSNEMNGNDILINLNYSCSDSKENQILKIDINELINDPKYINKLSFYCNSDNIYNNKYCIGLNSLPKQKIELENINDSIDKKCIPIYYNNNFYQSEDILNEKIRNRLNKSLNDNNNTLNNLQNQINNIYTNYDSIQNTAKKHNIKLDNINPIQNISNTLKLGQNSNSESLENVKQTLNNIDIKNLSESNNNLMNEISSWRKYQDDKFNLKELDNDIYSITKKIIIRNNENKRQKKIFNILVYIFTFCVLFAVVSFLILSFIKKKI